MFQAHMIIDQSRLGPSTLLQACKVGDIVTVDTTRYDNQGFGKVYLLNSWEGDQWSYHRQTYVDYCFLTNLVNGEPARLYADLDAKRYNPSDEELAAMMPYLT